MTEKDIPQLIDQNAVFMLRGLPGAGKTTWAEKTFKGKMFSIYSADHYFEQNDGSYFFEKEKIGKAHGECLKRFVLGLNHYGSLSYNCPLVVDNTNLFALDLSPYVNLAQAYERKWCIITFHVEAHIAFKRQKHGVDEKAFSRKVDYFTNERLPKFWLDNHIEMGKSDQAPVISG
jgi:predicted kinase